MKKLCCETGCRVVTSNGNPRCPKHQRKSIRRAPVIERAAFYGTSAWRALSKNARAARPICELCNRELSADADHWLERSIAGADQYELHEANIVALCKSCHRIKSTKLYRLINQNDYQRIYLHLLANHPRQMDVGYLHDWIRYIKSAREENQI